MGRTSLVTIGWTTKTSEAEVKMATGEQNRGQAVDGPSRRAFAEAGLAGGVGHARPVCWTPPGRAFCAPWTDSPPLRKARRHVPRRYPDALAARVIARGLRPGPDDRRRRKLHGRPGSPASTDDRRSRRPWSSADFVTYGNAAKTSFWGSPRPDLIDRHGAVSGTGVARAMAEGALGWSLQHGHGRRHRYGRAGRRFAGIRVGLVHFAARGPTGLIHVEHRFGDIGREAVRLESVRIVLKLPPDRVGA